MPPTFESVCVWGGGGVEGSKDGHRVTQVGVTTFARFIWPCRRIQYCFNILTQDFWVKHPNEGY